MNFSHNNYDFHTNIYNTVRKVAKNLNKEVAVLCDLQGPKVRCNTFPGGKINLERGKKISIIYSKEPGKPGLITTDFLPAVERF
jgi:pyruvate kinase